MRADAQPLGTAGNRSCARATLAQLSRTGALTTASPTIRVVKTSWTVRMAQLAGKHGEHAPTAAVCCNACRTCATTNLVSLGMAGLAGAGYAVARVGKRLVKTS